MRKRTLLGKTMAQLAVSVAAFLLLATPLFFLLTKNFYAEDLADFIEAVRNGKGLPAVDIEQDIMQGVMLQFVLTATVLAAAIILTARFVQRRAWRPFDRTLQAIEDFRLETGKLPDLPESGVREFDRLNHALTSLMENCLRSYRVQKEFTENASHELQTPLAIFQSKLDLLLQEPGLTDRQAAAIQELYSVTARLTRLNRSLLLLARMDNRQYDTTELVDVASVLRELVPQLESLASGLTIHEELPPSPVIVRANRPLLEVLVNNLVVNAVRYNRPGGGIRIVLSATSPALSVSNTSALPALDATKIFDRFYHSAGMTKGNGLGLALVRAVCLYHGWKVSYNYSAPRHIFLVSFEV